jgi:hypothetical protein
MDVNDKKLAPAFPFEGRGYRLAGQKQELEEREITRQKSSGQRAATCLKSS